MDAPGQLDFGLGDQTSTTPPLAPPPVDQIGMGVAAFMNSLNMGRGSLSPTASTTSPSNSNMDLGGSMGIGGMGNAGSAGDAGATFTISIGNDSMILSSLDSSSGTSSASDSSTSSLASTNSATAGASSSSSGDNAMTDGLSSARKEVEEILASKPLSEKPPESVTLADANVQLRRDLMNILSYPQTFDVTFIVGPGVTWSYTSNPEAVYSLAATGSTQPVSVAVTSPTSVPSPTQSQSQSHSSSSSSSSSSALAGDSTTTANSATNGSSASQRSKIKTVRVLASRALLAARSPVFAPMLLTSGMYESRHPSEPICLPDVDAAAFVRLVEFAMTGSTSVPPDSSSPTNILSLHALADKFALDTLTTCCREWLRGALTAETVVDALQQPRQLIPDSLLEVCYGFVDQCSHVFDKPGLAGLPLATLQTIIKRKTLEVPEVKVFQLCVRWAKNMAHTIKAKWIQGRKARLLNRLRNAAAAALPVYEEESAANNPSTLFKKRKAPASGFMTDSSTGADWSDTSLETPDSYEFCEMPGLGNEFEIDAVVMPFAGTDAENEPFKQTARWTSWDAIDVRQADRGSDASATTTDPDEPSRASAEPASTRGSMSYAPRIGKANASARARGELLPGNMYLPGNIKALVPESIQAYLDSDAVSDIAEGLRRALLAESVRYSTLASPPKDFGFDPIKRDLDEPITDQSFFFSKGHHLPRRYEASQCDYRRLRLDPLMDYSTVAASMNVELRAPVASAVYEHALASALGADDFGEEQNQGKRFSQLDWLRLCNAIDDTMINTAEQQGVVSRNHHNHEPEEAGFDGATLTLLSSSRLVHPEDRERCSTALIELESYLPAPTAAVSPSKPKTGDHSLTPAEDEKVDTLSIQTRASIANQMNEIVQCVQETLQQLYFKLLESPVTSPDAAVPGSAMDIASGPTSGKTKSQRSRKVKSSGSRKASAEEMDQFEEEPAPSVVSSDSVGRGICTPFKQIGAALIAEIARFIEDEYIESSLTIRDLTRILMVPLVPYIRFGIMEAKEIMRFVKPTDLVDPHIVDTALAYLSDASSVALGEAVHTWGEGESAGAILPGGGIYYAQQYQLRQLTYQFDLSVSDGSIVVSEDGQKFMNLASDTEASGTVSRPIRRSHNRFFIFDVKLDAQGTSPTAARKGFYGVGIMRDPMPKLKEGVTSKANGTLYYSNGWISSFGQTLDKSGSLPHFEIGNKIGFKVDLEQNTIQFRLDGHSVGPVLPLNEAFVQSGVMYPVVRLKSNSTATICRQVNSMY